MLLSLSSLLAALATCLVGIQVWQGHARWEAEAYMHWAVVGFIAILVCTVFWPSSLQPAMRTCRMLVTACMLPVRGHQPTTTNTHSPSAEPANHGLRVKT